MTILQYIKADVKNVPKTLGYKLDRNIITIKDQEEALGADIRKCEEAACKDPYWAYEFARKHPEWAYQFALHVPGADIKRCEKAACNDCYIAQFLGKFTCPLRILTRCLLTFPNICPRNITSKIKCCI